MRPTPIALAFARPIFVDCSSLIEFLARPQLLTRHLPLPVGRDIIRIPSRSEQPCMRPLAPLGCPPSGTVSEIPTIGCKTRRERAW